MYDEIAQYNKKLKNLKNEYNQMTDHGVDIESKLEILKEIDLIVELIDNLLVKEQLLIYEKRKEIEDIKRQNGRLQNHHHDLVFKRDFFFDNLLFILNSEDEKFAKLNIKFDEHGNKGRDGHGNETFGTNYYDYTILGSVDGINKLKEFHILDNMTLWVNSRIRINNKNEDLIICSKNYYFPSWPQIYGESREIEIYGMTECRHYKGLRAREIDNAIDTMYEIAKEYGIDFNQSLLGRKLIKKLGK